jgi:D-alanine-D-alanine ligase
MNIDGFYIIKSVWEHASKGINQNSIFHSTCIEEFLSQIKRQTSQTGWDCFAESYIEGREFNLSILESGDGPEVLPAAEIQFLDYPEGKFKIVDYPAKWEKESFEYKHTCRCFDFIDTDKNLLQQLSTISLKCWNLFKLRGYARIDFRIDIHGNPWVLEVNTNPCLAPDSGFVAATRQAGFSFDQVLERIINAAFL